MNGLQEILRGKRVELIPLDDVEYLLELADKDNKHAYSLEEIQKTIEVYGREFWEIRLNGSRRGIVGYFQFGDVYVLEALKDHSKPPTGIGYSIEVGQLMLDYMFKFTNKVRTCARDTDLGIQILIKKLGFQQIDIKDNLIIYEKGK